MPIGAEVFCLLFEYIFDVIVLILVYKIKKMIGEKHALISFPVLWLAFEYLHLNWDLTWSWLTLGNVFSIKQLGYSGMNIQVFWEFFMAFDYKYDSLLRFKKISIKSVFIKTFTLCFSVFNNSFIYFKLNTLKFFRTSARKVNVVIVQPNYEPHFENLVFHKILNYFA